jgi:TolB-like protein
MNRITRLATLTAAVCLIAPLSVSSAQSSAPVVAVVAFNLHGAANDSRDFAGVGSAIGDLLAADLAANANVRLLDRAQVHRTVAIQPLSRNGMVDRGAAASAAKLLGARHVVYGGFSADAAGNVRLDARGADASTGAVEFTARLQGRGDDIVALVHELATRLVAGMSLPARSGAAGAGSALPLSAVVSYGKALDAVDRGDQAQARERLGALVRDHPGFAAARSALAGLGGT